MSEHQEQSALIKWFRYQHPNLTMFAIPNGSHLAGDKRQRAIKMTKMKAEGFLNGVSDLFLMTARSGFNGLFVEMKIKKGKPTESQLDFGNKALGQNYCYVVAYGFDDAKAQITEYLK
jgi:hypothetical protein